MSLKNFKMTDISARNETPQMLKDVDCRAAPRSAGQEKGDDGKRQQKQETRNFSLTESAEPFTWTEASYAIPARTDGAEHKVKKQPGDN